MAEGGRPLSRPASRFADPDRAWKLGLGGTVALLLWIFLGGAFLALLAEAPDALDVGALLRDDYLHGVLLFTLEQAGLSAFLSVAGALPLALALHRTRFPGRLLVLRLFLLPQALPVLVGGLAILALWGRGGLLSEALAQAGLPRLDIYGLPGILIAHVFFNLPFATRLILAALDAVPGENWRLAGQLALPPPTVFRLVEWPAARRALPGAFALTFMICVTSFTLVLVLGGGPGATTLEVEIYQALRTDFDPNRAVVLALTQIALTTLFLVAFSKLGTRFHPDFTLGRPAVRFDERSARTRAVDGLVIALGLAFVLSPFAVVAVRGLRADLGRLLADPGVRSAMATSGLVSLSAALLAVALALALLLARETLAGAGPLGRRIASLTELSGGLILVVPPIVLGAGWFLLLRRWTDAFVLAPVMVVTTNAVMALPFVLKIAGPALGEALTRHRRLADHLGLRGWARLRHVEAPALKGPAGLGFALALALSLGDLGVIALFGNEDFVTLPYLLYQRLGSYRTADAAGLALILGLATLGLVLVAERVLSGRKDRGA